MAELAPVQSPTPTPVPTASPTPAPITKESVAKLAESAEPKPAAPSAVTSPGTAPPKPVEPTKSDAGQLGKIDVNPGYEQVDFSMFGPDVQKSFEPRFRRLYGQLKASDRRNQALEAEMKTIREGFEQHRTELAKNSFDYNVQMLKTYMDQAIQQGDSNAAIQYRDQMMKLMQDGPPKVSPLGTERPNMLSNDEQGYVQAWAKARPWGDPKHKFNGFAMQMAKEIGNHPDWSAAGVDEILAQVDKQMSALMNMQAPQASAKPQQVQQQQQKPQAPAVLGNNSNLRSAVPPNPENELSHQERQIAENLRPMMAPKEAWAWYKQAKMNVN